jgi:hypothetical protein
VETSKYPTVQTEEIIDNRERKLDQRFKISEEQNGLGVGILNAVTEKQCNHPK